MSANPVYVTSDIHLGAVPVETEASFLRWLEWVGRDASRVVINGDLFDFWFEYGSVVPRGHTRVLGALAALVDAGIPVTFVGGNHDWWAGSFLRDEIGLELVHEPTTLELAGRRTLLAHGDGLGRGDLGYRLLKSVLRGRVTRWAFRWLHPDIGARVARRVSRTETEVDPEVLEARTRHLREWASAALRADPGLDLVVLGHTHEPVLEEVEPGRFYLNSGDWLSRRSYAVLLPGHPPVLEDWGEKDC